MRCMIDSMHTDLFLLLSGCVQDSASLDTTTSSTDASPPSTDDVVDTDDTDDTSGADDTGPAEPTDARPAVVLMIGDGMGSGHRIAGSQFMHGEKGQLFLESLPHSSPFATASLAGVTDSAAGATAMSTGGITWNGVIGLDRDIAEAENLLEYARQKGLAVGVVTTSALPHATPAAFTAHDTSRMNYVDIADDQVAMLPEVMLGGGLEFYLPKGEGSARSDDGLIAPLEEAGCTLLYSRDDLAAADLASAPCLVGLFASNHIDYEFDRTEKSTYPNLMEMTAAALERLDQDEDGFVLMVEGARIDMASHSNDLERMIGEMVMFDQTVETVHTWLKRRKDPLLLVTADHETGGLEVLSESEAGAYPAVSWRLLQHSNANITAYGEGPGSEVLDGLTLQHPWIHSIIMAYLDDAEIEAPVLPTLLPDGVLTDQRWMVTTQGLTTDFGEGYNQLDAFRIDAGQDGLFFGIDGLFEWEQNAVVLLIDTDPGQGTGTADLSGAFSDTQGKLESILTSLSLTAPPVSGFGAELAVLSVGGAYAQLGGLTEDAGVRGLTESMGAPDDLWWLDGVLSYGEDVRVSEASTAMEGEGLEGFIPWRVLYPEENGLVPRYAAVDVVAVLVNTDGSVISNQALPSFSEDPASSGDVALPGVVRFTIDSDGDSIPDGNVTPELL